MGFNEMRKVYIAHPVRGDVAGNLERIRLIVRKTNLEEDSILPLAPYFLDCQALDDNIPEERARGVRNSQAVLELVDELWLFGDRISEGMKEEIEIAHEIGIKVVPKTEETRLQYELLCADIEE